MAESDEQPLENLRPTATPGPLPKPDIDKIGALTPELETLQRVEIIPEEVTPEDVFTLNDIPKESDEPLGEKQKTYLSRLMGTPGKWLRTDHPVYQLMDGFLSATTAHALSLPKFVGAHFFEPLAEKVAGRKVNLTQYGSLDRFLQEQLQNYNPEYHKKIQRDIRKHPLVGIAVKLMLRKVKTGDFLGAYESFWGSFNPIWRHPNRMFYKGAGGEEKPFFATVTTMGYNGFMHVFHPLALPIYLGAASQSSHPEQFISEAAVRAGTAFAVLGVPVGVRKYLRNRKVKIEDVDKSISPVKTRKAEAQLK